MIIGLTNQKGGVGKTTVAVNLAGALARRPSRVLLVDTDPQGSVLQWHSVGGIKPPFGVHHHPRQLTRRELKSLARGCDHVVIDTPPALGDIVAAVIGLVDRIIVPVGPSPLDIWSSRETIARIRARKGAGARLLVARKIVGTRVGRAAREAIESYRLPVFQTELCQRIAYVEAMIAGLTVFDFAPNSEAAAEMDALCREMAK